MGNVGSDFSECHTNLEIFIPYTMYPKKINK